VPSATTTSTPPLHWKMVEDTNSRGENVGILKSYLREQKRVVSAHSSGESAPPEPPKLPLLPASSHTYTTR
jgi:hypothetical protein